MKKVFVKAGSYYQPDRLVTNQDLEKEFGAGSLEKVASVVGVTERRVAGENEFVSDMAVRAAQGLFQEYSITPKIVDFVLLCTQNPDYLFPTTACLVQDRLGIPTAAGALDFNLGCSGFVYGLAVAKGLVSAGVASNVLLLTSDIYTKRVHPQDKGSRVIYGDAATATLVSTEGFAEIGEFSLGTDGAGAENIILRSGGLRHPRPLNDLHYNQEGDPVSSDHFAMDGGEVFGFTMKNVPLLVEDTLKKNGLAQGDISLFVFHQPNNYMTNFLRKKIKIPEDRFIYCLQGFGNTVSSTIPIALKEAEKQKRLKGNILLAGFGVGYSWAGTVLKV